VVTTDAERLRRLAAWERVFGDPAFSAGRAWRGPSPDVVRFADEMAELRWSTRPDYAAWAATPEGRALLDDDQLVLRASADELALLLTTILRGDRFNAGVLDAAFANGTMLRIARRARVLLWTTVNQPDPAQA
jgi:hypothetical protein